MNLPKREELWFLTVLALPKLSRMGLDWSTHRSTLDAAAAAFAAEPSVARVAWRAWLAAAR
jgi:hypothetical protein